MKTLLMSLLFIVSFSSYADFYCQNSKYEVGSYGDPEGLYENPFLKVIEKSTDATGVFQTYWDNTDKPGENIIQPNDQLGPYNQYEADFEPSFSVIVKERFIEITGTLNGVKLKAYKINCEYMDEYEYEY